MTYKLADALLRRKELQKKAEQLFGFKSIDIYETKTGRRQINGLTVVDIYETKTTMMK